eukprot:9143471-Pyramimonas_sp.AAC.1
MDCTDEQCPTKCDAIRAQEALPLELQCRIRALPDIAGGIANLSEQAGNNSGFHIDSANRIRNGAADDIGRTSIQVDNQARSVNDHHWEAATLMAAMVRLPSL